jgi:hypothetical protein
MTTSSLALSRALLPNRLKDRMPEFGQEVPH